MRRVYGAQQIPKMPTRTARDFATFLSLESLNRCVMPWETIRIRFSKDSVEAEYLQFFLLQVFGFPGLFEPAFSASLGLGLASAAACGMSHFGRSGDSAGSFCSHLQHFKDSFASGLVSIPSVKDWLCTS